MAKVTIKNSVFVDLIRSNMKDLVIEDVSKVKDIDSVEIIDDFSGTVLNRILLKKRIQKEPIMIQR